LSDPKPRFGGLRRWLPDLLVISVILGGFYWYRTQDMLATGNEPAPPLNLPVLDGGVGGLRNADGKPVLVYFFAPWCKVCAASSHNLRNLRWFRDEEDLAVYLVVLDWQDRAEVTEYVERHDLDFPVLLGDSRTAQAWGISVFPSYYMLDDEHRIRRRDFGYSTLLGLWLRTFGLS
jgi:peroxiredoxin